MLPREALGAWRAQASTALYLPGLSGDMRDPNRRESGHGWVLPFRVGMPVPIATRIGLRQLPADGRQNAREYLRWAAGLGLAALTLRPRLGTVSRTHMSHFYFYRGPA